MIREHSLVVLEAPVREARLEPDDVGSVVHAYDDGRAYEVEFTALDGHTVAVVTLDAALVREVRRTDMNHARVLHAL